GFEVGAVLDLDHDQDGDRDALVALRSPTAAALALATREGGSYRLSELAAVSLPEGCTAGPARIAQTSEGSALARVEHSCEYGTTVTAWALELGPSPRLRETVRALPPAQGDPPLGVELSARDLDEDGRVDLVAALRVAEGEPIELRWLDRP